jgi:uridylate kinase
MILPMNKIVISLGGSLLAPKQTDAVAKQQVVLRYAHWLSTLAKQALVIVIVGGGNTARVRIDEAKNNNPNITAEELDWIGIKATHENANNLKQVIEQVDYAIAIHPTIVTDPNLVVQMTTGLVIGGGWKPGRSTDYDAVKIASVNGITTVYNLSNVGRVFTKDPNQYPDAQPLPHDITWQQLIGVIGEDWQPGLSAPFDPIAAKLALESGITVKLVQGDDAFTEIDRALLGNNFSGTVIHS